MGTRLRYEDVQGDPTAGSRHDSGRVASPSASTYDSPGTTSAPPLPRVGEKLSEDQMEEMFGVPPFGGIRTSKTSNDIILVSRVDVPTSYDDKDSGEYVYYDGYPEENKGKMADWRNKALSESGKRAARVLFFIKEHGNLAFHGRVEYAGCDYRGDQARGRVPTFKLKRISDVASQTVGSTRYSMVVSIAEDEDGGYVATAPALEGCMSQGETKAQAMENLQEAISLYLEYLLEIGEAFPPGLTTTLDVADINVQGENVSAKINAVLGCMPS